MTAHPACRPSIVCPPTPTCSSSDPVPAAARRRPCSPRRASTSWSSRKVTWCAKARSSRSRSSRWAGSTAPVASPRPSVARRSPTPRAAAPEAARRSTPGCTAALRKRCSTGGGRHTARRSRHRRAVRDLRRGRGGTVACSRSPARRSRASERLRSGPQRLGWDHGEIPRWMAYVGADGHERSAPQHDRDVSAPGDVAPGPARRRPAGRSPRRRSSRDGRGRHRAMRHRPRRRRPPKCVVPT